MCSLRVICFVHGLRISQLRPFPGTIPTEIFQNGHLAAMFEMGMGWNLAHVYYVPWCTFWSSFKYKDSLATACAVTFQFFKNFYWPLWPWKVGQIKKSDACCVGLLCLNVPPVQIFWKSAKLFKCILCIFRFGPLVAKLRSKLRKWKKPLTRIGQGTHS